MAGPALKDTTIAKIERTLTELRLQQTGMEHAPSQRTSVMTHMAWVPKQWTDMAARTLDGLGERHPSRTILLHPDPDDPRDALDADVDLRCFASGGGAVCFEVIDITLCGPRAHAPASVVSPLLIHDLPAFLRWRGDLPFGSTELEQLLGVADRLILDSTEWEDPAHAFTRVPEVFEWIAASDIAWIRLEPWRRTLAMRWPGIAELGKLHVTGPKAEALLLAGWLGGRLHREIPLEHTDADTTSAVSVDGEELAPDHPERDSASDMLSEQLDIFDRDLIYEEAVRSFSRVAI